MRHELGTVKSSHNCANQPCLQGVVGRHQRDPLSFHPQRHALVDTEHQESQRIDRPISRFHGPVNEPAHINRLCLGRSREDVASVSLRQCLPLGLVSRRARTVCRSRGDVEDPRHLVSARFPYIAGRSSPGCGGRGPLCTESGRRVLSHVQICQCSFRLSASSALAPAAPVRGNGGYGGRKRSTYNGAG
jgi:hypothetical protein